MPEGGIFLVVCFALAFDFINGFHDTANAIATSVTTRVLTPATALLMAAVLNFAGALINTEVAHTIGKGVVEPGLVTNQLLIAGLLGAIFWNLITWYLGLPISSSHALIGGLVGAAVACRGIAAVNAEGLAKSIFLPLVLSPLIGFLVACLLMVVILFFFNNNPVFKKKACIFSRLQVASAAFVAFCHGSNDAQKSMGIITTALYTAGIISSFKVPLTVVIACALAMALGTAMGGWRIIKTLGQKLTHLEPMDGFIAETAAAVVVLLASLWGKPVSTTHVIASSITGVGMFKRFSGVCWSVVRNIVISWLLTVPAAAFLASISFYALKKIC